MGTSIPPLTILARIACDENNIEEVAHDAWTRFADDLKTFLGGYPHSLSNPLYGARYAAQRNCVPLINYFRKLYMENKREEGSFIHTYIYFGAVEGGPFWHIMEAEHVFSLGNELSDNWFANNGLIAAARAQDLDMVKYFIRKGACCRYDAHKSLIRGLERRKLTRTKDTDAIIDLLTHRRK